MNGGEVLRKTCAKQANTQTQARQPNKQMVAKVQGRHSLSLRVAVLVVQEAKSSLSSNSNNAKDNVD